MLIEAFNRAHKNFPEGGTCLEFGVWTGISYINQAKLIVNQYPYSSLIGFDSWMGLPDEDKNVWKPDRHAAGNYKANKDVVLKKLEDMNLINDSRFTLIDGFFEHSLNTDLQKRIYNLIFVNIDVDLYISCIQILEFIKPLLRPGVILYFDDWKDPDDKYNGKWGEHLAWEEFIIKYPDIKYRTLVVNELNQRYIEIG